MKKIRNAVTVAVFTGATMLVTAHAALAGHDWT